MASQACKTNGKKELFDGQFSIERLSAIGNPLKKTGDIIDFPSNRISQPERHPVK